VKRFIIIAGNIGVGKSALTTLLSEGLGWEPFYEAVDENPYLSDFYKDMKHWSFHSQIFFLARKIRYHLEIIKSPKSVVQDRSIYEDAEIFAENLYRQGFMVERDYRTYRELYEAILPLLPPPDLIVYLRASVPTLQERIALRGREFERVIPREYLEQLNLLYDEWAEGFTLCPILTVPTDDLDFVKYPRHLEFIKAEVIARLK
jgi:deoxyadenosine/deoxycytidine kinase